MSGLDRAGAQWQGPESGCEPNPCPLPIGACCLSGGCVPDQELIECLNSGGQWAGPDTDCSAPGICEDGACCIGDACVVNPEPNCLRAYPKTPAARNVTQAQAKWRKAR